MRKEAASIIALAMLGGILALIIVGLWLGESTTPHLFETQAEPRAVMGTNSQLRVVVPVNQADRAGAALRAAEAALRKVEVAQMSWRVEGSDIFRLNAAEASQLVPMSAATIKVLEMAKGFTDHTEGAFDVTFAPVFSLWGAGGKANREPDPVALDHAREVSGWGQYEFQLDAVVKFHTEAKVDLGGIAKGYGIDRAVEAMIDAGAAGGLVNVGGDIRCFGKRQDDKPWRISIQNPFQVKGGKPLGILLLRDGAVCTSGNYRRYFEIDGKRYSHIIDPRTARPVAYAPSVTVVAPTAAEADAWATALSVLGPDGRELIDPASGIEAMIVVGTADDYRIYKTPSFDVLLERPATQPG